MSAVEAPKKVKRWRKFTKQMEKKLKNVKLQEGGHSSFEEGVCVMEAVALITGQNITDHPPCVANSVIEVAIQLNDGAKTDAQRQKLINFIPKLIGTAPTRKEMRGKTEYLVQDTNNKKYQELEERRQDFLESKKGRGVYDAKSFRAKLAAFERLLDVA